MHLTAFDAAPAERNAFRMVADRPERWRGTLMFVRLLAY